LEGILKECDNDIMKAIKKLFNNKNQVAHNPFMSNQENRSAAINSSFSNSGRFLIKTQFSGVSRKRKFHEMSCDSPVSNKTISNESDEEEKMPQCLQSEENLLNEYSRSLLHHLKSIPTEENAFSMIKECLQEYKKTPSQAVQAQPPAPHKRKITEKDRKMVADAIKKLSQDNVILKSAVRKLVEKDEKNSEKIRQFDNLAEAYQKLSEENKKLRNYIDILKYAARDKCVDSFYSHGYDNNSQGGSDVF
jgi:predicted Zn-dependent protease